MNNQSEFKTTLAGKLYVAASDNRLVFFSLIVTTVLTLIINRIDTVVSANSGIGMVYLQLSFTRLNFESVLASWGPNGIRYYIEHLWVLFLLPPAYALLLASSQGYTRLKRGATEDDLTPRDMFFFMVPFAAAFCDIFEKTLHCIILNLRIYSEWVIFSSSVAAVLKWFFLGFSVIIIVTSFFRYKKEQGTR